VPTSAPWRLSVVEGVAELLQRQVGEAGAGKDVGGMAVEVGGRRADLEGLLDVDEPFAEFAAAQRPLQTDHGAVVERRLEPGIHL
jgi:hypothetical protein